MARNTSKKGPADMPEKLDERLVQKLTDQTIASQIPVGAMLHICAKRGGEKRSAKVWPKEIRTQARRLVIEVLGAASQPAHAPVPV